MLQNYLTTLVRILLRQKIYSAINVFGLAIGIASSLLIALYVTDELSYDTFHGDAEQICRIGVELKLDGEESKFAVSGAPVGEAFYKEIAGIESYLRMVKRPVTPVEYKDKNVSIDNLILADSNFFSFFSFKLIAGDQKTLLTGPDKIVLTESAAKNIFGDQSLDYRTLIGKTVLFGPSKVATEITGIAENVPENSHLHFDAVLSIATHDPKVDNNSFLGLDCYNYIKLSEDTKIENVTAAMPSFFDLHINPALTRSIGATLEEFRKRGDEMMFVLTPLTNIHLDSHFLNEIESNGNRTYLYLLTLIASFVLLLACVNFVNLSTARGANRAKEVGIRKTIGALQKRLIGQFMFESFIYTIVALFIGLALISLVIGPFNFLASKHLSIDQFFTLEFAAGIIILVFIISILAGSYPSFYISSFRPAQVLKGKLGIGSRGSGLRNTMVTFQFVVSAVLIMGSIIVYQQLEHLQTQSPGYSKENVVCLTNTLSLKDNAEPFKNEIKSSKEFLNAGFCSNIPSEIVEAAGHRRKGSDQWNTLSDYEADEDYFNTLKLEVTSGRFFSKEFPSDSDAVVINEAAARMFGIKNLDQKEYMVEPGKSQITYEIIGIAKDFNFESLKSEIKPLVIYKGGVSRMTVRLTPGATHEKIVLLEKIWKKYTNAPFEYTFLDERLNGQYKSEAQLGKIAIVLTCLSIIIACLGLLGLVTYMASQRTKEIGIRKVLGASINQIAVLLSKDFLRLVTIAFVIAIPVTWYSMNKWLEGFAYRINFNGLVVVTAGSIIVVIALLTISYQSIKAAMGNPVDSLRSE